jgi:hypothetical protein
MQSFDDLLKEWNKKLKDSGFVDIEANNSGLMGSKNMNPYKKKAANKLEAEWYRIVGLYAHHCPKLKDKYVEALLLVSEGQSYKEISDKIEGITESGLKKFMSINRKKIIDFCINMEHEEYFND